LRGRRLVCEQLGIRDIMMGEFFHGNQSGSDCARAIRRYCRAMG
jgi:hypothetical protein